MTTLRTTARALFIWAVFLLFGTVFAVRWAALMLTTRGRASPDQRAEVIGQTLLLLFGTLGATFIKVAQYLSTRPDLVPPVVATALQQLQDRAEPFPYHQVRSILRHELGEDPEQLFRELDPYPVACASVAQVHRGLLAEDGQEVALKVLRPGIERVVALDLSLMRVVARLLCVIPPVRMLALEQVVEEFAQAIQAQLDLGIEAQNNLTFAANFADDADVDVPALVPRLCSRRVLCMEFIEGRKILSDQQLPAEEAQRLARAGFRLLLRMIVAHGFVHADLHPGNLLVSGQRLVMLDLGLVARLSPAHRVALMQLFAAWLARDAARICQVMNQLLVGEVPAEGNPELEQQVSEMLERYSTVALGQVSMAQVLQEVLRLMRRHQLQVQPALTMVILSVGLVEGVGRQLAPELDLAQEAVSYAAAGPVAGAASS